MKRTSVLSHPGCISWYRSCHLSFFFPNRKTKQTKKNPTSNRSRCHSKLWNIIVKSYNISYMSPFWKSSDIYTVWCCSYIFHFQTKHLSRQFTKDMREFVHLSSKCSEFRIKKKNWCEYTSSMSIFLMDVYVLFSFYTTSLKLNLHISSAVISFI